MAKRGITELHLDQDQDQAVDQAHACEEVTETGASLPPPPSKQLKIERVSSAAIEIAPTGTSTSSSTCIDIDSGGNHHDNSEEEKKDENPRTSSMRIHNNHLVNNNNNDDVYSRAKVTKTQGRGALAGWAACPLCNSSTSKNKPSNINEKRKRKKQGQQQQQQQQQQKKYALGRGITMHLQQVHTPWKPGKAELARRERIRRRTRGFVYQTFKKDTNTVLRINTGVAKATTTSKVRATPQALAQAQAQARSNCATIEVERGKVITIPIVQEGEKQDDYEIRLLQLLLGDVWNRNQNMKSINTPHTGISGRPTHYEPTQEERNQWCKRVIQIASYLEEQYETTSQLNLKMKAISPPDDDDDDDDDAAELNNHNNQNGQFVQAGFDRNGAKSHSYKESLPPFLKAASVGDLNLMQSIVDEHIRIDILDDKQDQNRRYKDGANTNKKDINLHVKKKLLACKDRNGSCAEHWAAGNGHLHCLDYLMNLVPSDLDFNVHIDAQKRSRRRDGKTTLHYAARNGHTHILKYLLEDVSTSTSASTFNPKSKHGLLSPPQAYYTDVDVPSGDGTTPLHLACYGGHLNAVKYLITEQKANIFNVNDWNCGIGHWIAMSTGMISDVHALLDFVKETITVTTTAPGTKSTAAVAVASRQSALSIPPPSECTPSISSKAKSSKFFEIFGRTQKQGHSAVHKAAQKFNKHGIERFACESIEEWSLDERLRAGDVDIGGHKPSTIWKSLGGDDQFSRWMKENCKW